MGLWRDRRRTRFGGGGTAGTVRGSMTGGGRGLLGRLLARLTGRARRGRG